MGMFIEFKVTNFRSIREEQTLSLVAAKADKSLNECVIDVDLPGMKGVRYLKGAALYGANASGKSNVLEAVRFVKNFVTNSATDMKPGDPTGTEPFKLSREWANRPSSFEITFVAQGVRYLFGFSVTPTRVTEEYLVAYPKRMPQQWYRRCFNEESRQYEWETSSSSFKDDKDLEEKTRENALFLSVGPQFNHPQLSPVYEWFNNNLRMIDLGVERGLSPVFTAQLMQESNLQEGILNLLKSADIGITSASIDEEEYDLPLPEEIKSNFNPERILTKIDNKYKLKELTISLMHGTDADAPIALNFHNEESAGTRRYFALLGPWIDLLSNGYCVFIDEIETSLHPLLVRELLRLIFNSEINRNNAQLIFTTHNPLLLDTAFIRRDQVWFTEKTQDGATHLYPLTDYQPRKDEALAKGYLAGRYGAIPFLPNGLKP